MSRKDGLSRPAPRLAMRIHKMQPEQAKLGLDELSALQIERLAERLAPTTLALRSLNTFLGDGLSPAINIPSKRVLYQSLSSSLMGPENLDAERRNITVTLYKRRANLEGRRISEYIDMGVIRQDAVISRLGINKRRIYTVRPDELHLDDLGEAKIKEITEFFQNRPYLTLSKRMREKIQEREGKRELKEEQVRVYPLASDFAINLDLKNSLLPGTEEVRLPILLPPGNNGKKPPTSPVYSNVLSLPKSNGKNGNGNKIFDYDTHLKKLISSLQQLNLRQNGGDGQLNPAYPKNVTAAKFWTPTVVLETQTQPKEDKTRFIASPSINGLVGGEISVIKAWLIDGKVTTEQLLTALAILTAKHGIDLKTIPSGDLTRLVDTDDDNYRIIILTRALKLLNKQNGEKKNSPLNLKDNEPRLINPTGIQLVNMHQKMFSQFISTTGLLSLSQINEALNQYQQMYPHLNFADFTSVGADQLERKIFEALPENERETHAWRIAALLQKERIMKERKKNRNPRPPLPKWLKENLLTRTRLLPIGIFASALIGIFSERDRLFHYLNVDSSLFDAGRVLEMINQFGHSIANFIQNGI